MRKLSLYGILSAIAIFIGLSGCNKINGIDNNQVIQTPYSLFFSDTAGALYSSNDGTAYKTLFHADGKPCRAICATVSPGAWQTPTILWIKDNMYISTNNGQNFNHAYDSVLPNRLPCCGSDDLPLNQTMIIDVKGWSSTYQYVASSNTAADVSNLFGVAFSQNQLGALGSWQPDPVDSNGHWGFLPAYGTSFTQLANKVLVAYDALRDKVFNRSEGTQWVESTGNGPGIFGRGSPFDQSGTGLPDTAYCIGHLNNRLIALINRCSSHGAWFSDDTGRNWASYGGLPQNPLLCISSPFEQVCLVGTNGAGLYILNLNTGLFQQNLSGLGNNLIVRSITSKENIFKNGNTQRFIYIATNKGIYQSKDLGINWTRTVPGNFVAIY